MAATIFNLSGTDIDGNAFDLHYGALGDRSTLPTTATRWGYTILYDAPVYQLNTFHPPGVQGNVVINNGRTATRFSVTAVYVGPLDQVLLNYAADSYSLSGVPVTITEDLGSTTTEITRCYLDAMTKERPVGCDDGAYIIVHMQFTSHGEQASA